MFARCPLRACLLLALLLAAPACNRSVDVKQALEVADTSSGWFDAGIVDGKNNRAERHVQVYDKPTRLPAIALNIAFRYVPAVMHTSITLEYVYLPAPSHNGTRPTRYWSGSEWLTVEPPKSGSDAENSQFVTSARIFLSTALPSGEIGTSKFSSI